VSGEPFPKSSQLARGERRYRRRVASPKQWQAIAAEKQGPCRVCVQPSSNGHGWHKIQWHHIVPRAAPYFGDDVAENIAPLCLDCHPLVTRRDRAACRALAASLTDSEYAYVIARCGEGALERLYGVGR
jgi:hypothetical protein